MKPKLIPLNEWHFRLTGHAQRRFCQRIYPLLTTEPDNIITWLKNCEFANQNTIQAVRHTCSHHSPTTLLQHKQKGVNLGYVKNFASYVFVAVGKHRRPTLQTAHCKIFTFLIYELNEHGAIQLKPKPNK